MMIGTETHADIRHVVFSNMVVRDSNKVFGINVQDGGTVSDVRFANVTLETNRRHGNGWGSAEVMKLEGLILEGFKGEAGRSGVPAIVRERVR